MRIFLKTFAAIVTFVMCSATMANADPLDTLQRGATTTLAGLKPVYTADEVPQLQAVVFRFTKIVDPRTIPESQYANARRLYAEGWARIFSVIDRSYDATFDASNIENQPETCEIPPMESDGTELQPCADPSDIKDPRARAIYEREIAQNNIKIERMQNFYTFYHADLLDIFQFQYIMQQLHSSPNDPAIDAILRGAGLGDRRVRTLEAAM